MESLNKLTRKLIITRVFCTFPVIYDDKLQRYRKQPFKWLYCICFTTLTVILFTACSIEIGNKPNSKRETLRVGLKICQMMIAFVIISTSYFTRHRLAKSINGYLEIDKLMRKAGAPVRYKILKYILITKHSITFTLIILSNIICFSFNEYSTECATYIAAYNVTYIISSLISTSVCALMALSLTRLQILNCSAYNIVLKDNYDPMDKKPKIPINRRFPKKTLRTISLLYYKIVKVSNMLNQTFSFQIILMLYKSLITILESIDYCLSNATGITIWTDLFWSCATMLEVLIMFLLTTKLQSQTKETAKIVNMIEPNKNDMMQIEKIIFLLQAKQHKLDLTACKLFPLNANMFLKLCATTLTYIVLIQDPNNHLKN